MQLNRRPPFAVQHYRICIATGTPQSFTGYARSNDAARPSAHPARRGF